MKMGFLCQAYGVSNIKCGGGYFVRSSSNSIVFPWIFFGTVGIELKLIIVKLPA